MFAATNLTARFLPSLLLISHLLSVVMASPAKPRGLSIGDRFSAFLGRTPASTPAATPQKSASDTGDAASRELRTPEKTRTIENAATPSVADAPAVATPTSSSSGFFGGLKAKATQALTAHRLEAAERSAFKASGLEKINSRMFVLKTEPNTDTKKQFQASVQRVSRATVTWLCG